MENEPEDVNIEQLVARNRELEERVRQLEEENLRCMHIIGTNRLSGLPNSLMLYEVVLPGALRKGDEQGVSVACLLISPDGLGEINQEYGRALGDEIIKETATFLFGEMEEDEHLFHPDGANFAILILNGTEERALEKADQIRKEFPDTTITTEEWELTGMTCSVSVATIEGVVQEDDIPETVDRLYHDLSDRLDRAKQSGGDIIAGSETEA